MTLALSTLLAQPFDLTGPYTGTVVDDTSPGGRTFTINNFAGVSKTYRNTLTPSVQSGTEDNPYELHFALQSALNAGTAGGNWWQVQPFPGGLTQSRIRYVGAVTAGSITWGAGALTTQVIKNLLGFTANIGPLATGGGIAAAAYMPTHLLLAYVRPSDNEWTSTPHGVAAAKTGLGQVYTFESGVEAFTRQFTLGWHPKNITVAGAELGTPMFPIDKTRWRQPTAIPSITLVPPWSVHEFMATARGRKMGVLLGNLLAWAQGSVTTWDAAYLDPQTWEGRGPFIKPSIPLVDHYYDRTGIVLSFSGTES